MYVYMVAWIFICLTVDTHRIIQYLIFLLYTYVLYIKCSNQFEPHIIPVPGGLVYNVWKLSDYRQITIMIREYGMVRKYLGSSYFFYRQLLKHIRAYSMNCVTDHKNILIYLFFSFATSVKCNVGIIDVHTYYKL